MNATTITLSTKGQFALPKTLRDSDDLEAGDVFRLTPQGPARYLLERMTTAPRRKARLVRGRHGFLVFQPAAGAPTITRDLVKQLESETV